MADWNEADEMTSWEQEMIKYASHEKLRSFLVAAVVLTMGALLIVGHALDHAWGRSLVPLGLDDLIAGYPTAGVIALAAYWSWRRITALVAVAPDSRAMADMVDPEPT